MGKLRRGIFATVNAISVVLFVFLVIIVFLQVIFRYVLKVSAPWTEELARVLLIWIIYLGIAEVERKRDSIRTTFFIEKLPMPVYKGILVLSNLAAISLMVCLFVGTIQQIQANSVYFLPSMPFISRTIFYVPVLVGAPLCIWMQIEQIVDFIRKTDPMAIDEEEQ